MNRDNWPTWMTHMPLFDWPINEPFLSCDYGIVMTAKDMHELLMDGRDELWLPSSYRRFIEEVRDNGLRMPLAFSSTSTEHMMLRDGHHRIGALFSLGFKYAPHILRG